MIYTPTPYVKRGAGRLHLVAAGCEAGGGKTECVSRFLFPVSRYPLSVCASQGTGTGCRNPRLVFPVWRCSFGVSGVAGSSSSRVRRPHFVIWRRRSKRAPPPADESPACPGTTACCCTPTALPPTPSLGSSVTLNGQRQTWMRPARNSKST